ncbi:MAG: hypothetical protein OK455_10340 [Thaumarchaeota archaeon]|nr:hypothetical protein [Nitrososphaerota archaeon]
MATDVLTKALGDVSAAAILFVANPHIDWGNPEKFSKSLQEIYAQAADMVLGKIVDELYRRVGMKRDGSLDFASSVRELHSKLEPAHQK